MDEFIFGEDEQSMNPPKGNYTWIDLSKWNNK
jgi:hypothetical protein